MSPCHGTRPGSCFGFLPSASGGVPYKGPKKAWHHVPEGQPGAIGVGCPCGIGTYWDQAAARVEMLWVWPSINYNNYVCMKPVDITFSFASPRTFVSFVARQGQMTMDVMPSCTEAAVDRYRQIKIIKALLWAIGSTTAVRKRNAGGTVPPVIT